MAVTKRTRFEVLRRDGHACRYCGATAPDVKITVDHVTPTALGGTDDPSNLVAACADCNAGKSSSNPDASLVADVKDDAIRHAELMRQAYAVLEARIGERTDYENEAIEGYRYALPDDWRNSIGRWFEMGVPVTIIQDAVRIADAKVKAFTGTQRFTYMCGIVWNQVHAVTEEASARRYIAGSFLTAEAISELEIGAWQKGSDSGYHQGHAACEDRYFDHIIHSIQLEQFIDRGEPAEVVA